jgi:hypothetical protein
VRIGPAVVPAPPAIRSHPAVGHRQQQTFAVDDFQPARHGRGAAALAQQLGRTAAVAMEQDHQRILGRARRIARGEQVMASTLWSGHVHRTDRRGLRGREARAGRQQHRPQLPNSSGDLRAGTDGPAKISLS